MTYHFDESKANKAIKFIESLYLIEGEWAGKPFILQEWQRKIVSDLFGWVDENGLRQYRMAYISVARKAAKSTLAAAIGLYLLFADGEQGAQIVIAAADREQAGIIFRMASEMVARAPGLVKRSKIFTSVKRIVYPFTASYMHAISAEAYSKHGFNCHSVIYDELHAAPSRELWDVLNTSQGARQQPLFLQFTTAGYDKESICYEQYTYARRIQDGIIEDNSYYVYIAEAEREDDWKDEETWKKAQPSFGVTVKPDFYVRECKRAAETPSYQNTFKRLLLNMWTEQATRWIDITSWEDCLGEIDENELMGKECYAGLDLSATTDLSAVVLVFPMEDETFIVKSKFWLPADNLRDKIDKDNVPYDAWVRDGYLETTPGNVIDYAFIKQAILEYAEDYDLREIAYDRWNSTQIVVELSEEGLNMIPFGQGFASMSPASKSFEKIMLEKKLIHDGNPVLRWNVQNVAIKEDPAGNIKPDKSQSNGRIDGVIAAIMGLDRAVRNVYSNSAYEERGILTI
jgi:phage terminase large subunit-like protein